LTILPSECAAKLKSSWIMPLFLFRLFAFLCERLGKFDKRISINYAV